MSVSAKGKNMKRKQVEPLLQAGALQLAIHNSANFSSIATDAQGVIQVFNVCLLYTSPSPRDS